MYGNMFSSIFEFNGKSKCNQLRPLPGFNIPDIVGLIIESVSIEKFVDTIVKYYVEIVELLPKIKFSNFELTSLTQKYTLCGS